MGAGFFSVYVYVFNESLGVESECGFRTLVFRLTSHLNHGKLVQAQVLGLPRLLSGVGQGQGCTIPCVQIMTLPTGQSSHFETH